MLGLKLLGVALSFASAALAAYPTPGTVKGQPFVHDPSLVKGPDGQYRLYGTAPGISIATSTDRITWTYRGVAFPKGVPATDQWTGAPNANLWAPDVTYYGGQYVMYYSASTFGSKVSSIFLATSPDGLPGTWTDKGSILQSGANSKYNAIDPNVILVGSTRYLSWGSFQTGIYVAPLTSSGKMADNTRTQLAARGTNGAIEAPFIYKAGSYYYLFVSWDKCCSGISSTYKTMVTRSKQLMGPFLDKNGVAATAGGGTPVLESHDKIIGPGGASVITDADGPIIVYHWYTATANNLGINRLDFSSGWPVAV